MAAVPEEGSGRRSGRRSGSGRKKKRKEEEEVKRGNDDVKKKGRKVGGREDRKEIERVDRIELYGTLIRGRNSEGTGTL